MGLNTRLNNGVIAGNVPSYRDGCSSMSADSAAVRITFRKVTVSVAMEGLRVLGASSCMHPEEYNIVQLTVPHGNSVRVARPIEASVTAVPPAQSCDGISCQGLYEVPFRGKSAAGIRRTYVPHPYNITSGGSDSDLRGLGGSRHPQIWQARRRYQSPQQRMTTDSKPQGRSTPIFRAAPYSIGLPRDTKTVRKEP